MNVNTSTELQTGHAFQGGFKSRARRRMVSNLITDVDSNSPVNNEKAPRVATRQQKRKDVTNVFQAALETSCETDVSVIISRRKSAFFKHAKRSYDKCENVSSPKDSTAGKRTFIQPSDTKVSENKNDKKQYSKQLKNDAYSGFENPFTSAFTGDSTDTSQSKSFELSLCETASRPVVRKRGFLSRNTRSKKKGFDEDSALSSHDNDRQKKIKMNSNNVFEAAFETSIETDVSDISHRKSRFVKNKNIGKKCLSLEAFQNVLDSSTDVSDVQLCRNTESGVIDSQSGVSESKLLNNYNEEREDSDGKDATDTKYVSGSLGRLAEKGDNSSTDVIKQVNENSDVMYNEVINKNKSQQSEKSEPSNVSLHAQSHCTNLVNKTAESVLPVDVNTDKPIPDVVNVSIENAVLSPNNSVDKQSLYKQNSLVVNDSNGAGSDIESQPPSAVLHLETDYDSMDSSSESDASDHLQENPTLPSESESLNNNFTKEDCVSSHFDSVNCSDALDKTQHYTQNGLSINCGNNHSRSLPIRRSSRRSNSLMNNASVIKENDQLLILYSDAIVKVNENFDSMEMTDCSIPLEQTELSKASSNKSIPVMTSTQIVVDCHREIDRLSILSQVEGQNSILMAVNNNSKQNENPSATTKSIPAIETVRSIDVVSSRLASPNNQTLKTPSDDENPTQSSHANESLNGQLHKSTSKNQTSSFQNKDNSNLNLHHTLTNNSITVASLRKRSSPKDNSNHVQTPLRKQVANDSQINKENSPLLTNNSITVASLRKRSSPKDNSNHVQTPLRKQVANDSQINKENSPLLTTKSSLRKKSFNSSKVENSDSPEASISLGSKISSINGEIVNSKQIESKHRSKSDSNNSESKYEPSIRHGARRISNIDVSLSVFRNNHVSNMNTLKKDCELLEQMLTFPNVSKASTRKPKNTKERSKAGGSNVVCNENDISWFSKCNAPNLKKPKSWVSQNLYKSIIEKLQPTYSAKSRIRAEKFVLFLCDKVAIVQNLTEKELYKKQVSELIIEMARLKLVMTYFDFYDFVGKYLPLSFSLKSVPMITPFNRECMVDYEPHKLFSNIL